MHALYYLQRWRMVVVLGPAGPFAQLLTHMSNAHGIFCLVLGGSRHLAVAMCVAMGRAY